jgi:hypothetical protein
MIYYFNNVSVLFVFLSSLFGIDFAFKCILSILLPAFFFIIHLTILSKHFEDNVYLSPELILAYNNTLDQMGSSSLYWDIKLGDELSEDLRSSESSSTSTGEKK